MSYIILTGGIASGKSSVGKIVSKSGFTVIDADKIAHKVLDEKSGQIKNIFGDEFVKEGKVKRKKLGLLIFGDKNKRAVLESILHEEIYKQIEEKASHLQKQKKPFMIDIPLFFEKHGVYKSALTAVVYAPKEEQIKRLMQRNGLKREEAEARIAAQIDIEQKRAAADIVIDNSKDLAHLHQEVEKFIKFLKEKYDTQ
jgi:dephospho-CoA kinase